MEGCYFSMASHDDDKDDDDQTSSVNVAQMGYSSKYIAGNHTF